MAEPLPGFDIRRVLLLGGVILVIFFSVLFFFFRSCASSSRSTRGYTVVYSNLDLRDAANTVARLKELKIPYEIREQGHAVAVPKDKADQARLSLAEKNLPAGGVVGWEIFDESKLGATDFDRRIQLIRAISGELSRTIRRIQAVEDARVQIVLPETRLFSATVAPVTASVLLRLRPGFELTPEKINGIVHLVASSVENLQTENVTVIDTTGRILTAKPVEIFTQEAYTGEIAPQASTLAATPEAAPVLTVEARAASPEVISLEAIVSPVYKPLSPEEKILLKVRAKKELEMNLAGKAQEILNRFYPPNAVIVKVNAELEGLPSQGAGEAYEVKVKKVIAVILVDNRIDLTDKLKESTYAAVAAAIGYSRHKGDQILLQKVPFHLATPPPEIVKGKIEGVFPPQEKKQKSWWALLGVKNILLFLGFAAVILVVIFVSKGIKKEKARVETIEKAEPGMGEPAVSPAKTSLVNRLKSVAEANPEKIAEVLKSWLTE